MKFCTVASIVRVKNLEAAVTLTNQSEFANGSCLYTSNASAIRYFRENVDAGMLGINLGTSTNGLVCFFRLETLFLW